MFFSFIQICFQRVSPLVVHHIAMISYNTLAVNKKFSTYILQFIEYILKLVYLQLRRVKWYISRYFFKTTGRAIYSCPITVTGCRTFYVYSTFTSILCSIFISTWKKIWKKINEKSTLYPISFYLIFFI